jgi:hypothetical protein
MAFGLCSMLGLARYSETLVDTECASAKRRAARGSSTEQRPKGGWRSLDTQAVDPTAELPTVDAPDRDLAMKSLWYRESVDAPDRNRAMTLL